MRIVFSVLFGIFSCISFAQTYPDKPKIIVHVVVEQLRYDYLTRFSSNFGRQGFLKIMQEGTVCTNVHVPFAHAESASAYASISTGATPGSHGIIGNSWYNRLQKTRENALYNPSYFCVGCERANYYQSAPHNLLVSTFSDELIASTQAKSRSFSVGLTAESAIFMAGKSSNGVYWFDIVSGAWVTSSYYTQTLPTWLESFNRKKFGDIYLAKEWNTKYPQSEYSQSLPDNTDFEIGISNQITFPYTLSKLKNKYSPYAIVTQTPYGNTFTKDVVLELLEKEGVGKGAYTDYVSISFTALEQIGNAFGSLSKEVQDCMVRLDFELQFLLHYLELTYGKENFLLLVSSTYGVETPYKSASTTKNHGGVFKQVEALYILQKYLETSYGSGNWIEHSFGRQIYLNRDLIAQYNLSLPNIQDEAALFLLQLAGVSSVLTAHAMNSGVFFDETKQRIAHAYNQKRSGDIYYELLPGWTEQSTDKVAQHISSFSEITHVPLLWYGWKTKAQRIHTPIATTDIIPTLTEILAIQRPQKAYGTYIQGIFE